MKKDDSIAEAMREFDKKFTDDRSYHMEDIRKHYKSHLTLQHERGSKGAVREVLDIAEGHFEPHGHDCRKVIEDQLINNHKES